MAGLLLTAGCEKEAVVKGSPDCIKDKMGQFANEPVANPPAKIYSYQYKGRTVYYILARCCDIPGMLYDANCNFICSPHGGITGNGDGKCTDFFTTRSDEKPTGKTPATSIKQKNKQQRPWAWFMPLLPGKSRVNFYLAAVFTS